MNEKLFCPHCGAPVAATYSGCSDWEFACTAAANVCGARTSFWVRGFEDEPKEALRRFNQRAADCKNVSGTKYEEKA